MSAIRKILVATDFSPGSRGAEEAALTLAAKVGATVTIFHAYQFPTYVFFDGSAFPLAPSTMAQIVADVDAGLLAAKEAAAPYGLPVQTVTEYGDPTEQIVKYALEKGFDLIVMGTHGRSGLSRLFMGSVAERVARTSQIPVMIVPTRKGEEIAPSPNPSKRTTAGTLEPEPDLQ